MNVKKNDTVVVIAGGAKSKGMTGDVIATNVKNHTVTIKGVNLVKKAKKARRAQEVSQIVEIEAPIDVSNVMILCSACGKATRVKHAVLDGKKVRVCAKCGASLDKAFVKEGKKAEAPKAEAPKKRTRKRTAKAAEAVAETEVKTEEVKE